MKPKKYSPAHKSNKMAELVCSNSLKSDSSEKAAGILKNEMKELGSLILEAAYESKVSAGGALAVDREKFSEYITNKIKNNKLIEICNDEVTELPWSTKNQIIVVATGPLTSDSLSKNIEEKVGKRSLAFYDSISPIILYESIDKDKSFRASRYEDGPGDYINCPMNKVEYENFIGELIKSEKINFHDFEKVQYFEGCLPIEVMASRGIDTLRFGPMKPVGLIDPKTNKRPYAVIQLRKENQTESMWNIVGFQTKMKIQEQKRVFSMIPALKNAEFLRFGSIHKNTYLSSPDILNKFLQFRKNKNIFFAGQITGVEGYTESAAMGIIAGINASRLHAGMNLIGFPKNTALGTLLNYISINDKTNFQPMNINLGLFNIEKPKKNIHKIIEDSKSEISKIINLI